MRKIRLGRTELTVTEVSFGALPVQRVPRGEAVRLIRRAYEGGVNYFDTANAYTDSEQKLGLALSGVRREVILSTKSMAKDKKTVLSHIEQSLRALGTDYIDLFQLHNPESLPDPDDPDSALAAALEAKRRGYVRHIGVTNHRLAVAREAIASGLYDTLQFPFSYLASKEETELVALCRDADMGFIAMKALAGGLLTNAEACAAFMRAHSTVAPIWGIQRESELDEFLALAARDDLALTPELAALIERDRRELSGNFCRGCGYCLPCPAGIDIPTAARMNCMLRRAPTGKLLSKEYRVLMHRIDACTGCRACASRCPYGLDTPNLLKEMLSDYDAVYLARGER
ncbi:MAG: General stress protein 69 [Firmicutes bacterium ADurb.Bin248]|nr:MAG: General stress protein 69 [Firmicutes bacterium ADurb.Bin248]HOG01371.1 aldo/keto reductase [Clostridia bacterium]